MNQVIIMGRLTRDPEYKTSNDGTAYATYGVAVQRAGSEDKADFFDCITYKAGADFAQTYLHKGMKMLLVGELHHDRYTTQDGQSHDSFKIVVRSHEFAEPKAKNEPNPVPKQKKQKDDGFLNIPDGVDETGLPWS